MKKLFLVLLVLNFSMVAYSDDAATEIRNETCSYSEKVILDVNKGVGKTYSVCLAMVSCVSNEGRQHFHKMACEPDGNICPQKVLTCLDTTPLYKLEAAKVVAKNDATIDISGKKVSYRTKFPWIVAKQVNGAWSWACSTPVKWDGVKKSGILPVRACNANGPEGGKLDEMSCPEIGRCDGGLAFDTKPKLDEQVASVIGIHRDHSALTSSENLTTHRTPTAH
jgi:hypothetical protein